MTTKTTVISIVALVVGLILGASLVASTTKSPEPVLGGLVNTNPTQFTAGVSVGNSSPTLISKILTGTCNLTAPTDTLVAYTPKVAFCAVTGVVAGDKVFMQLATTTTSVHITGSSASSTNGYINATLFNATTTASQVTAVGTSTQYFIVR